MRIRKYEVSDIYIGGIYENNIGEKYKIIRELPLEERRYGGQAREFEIEFLKSGFKTNKLIGEILFGKVKDRSNDFNIAIGEIYQTNNFGKFKVLDKFAKGKNVYYNIQFLETGYITSVTKDAIKKKGIKDRLARSIYGFGAIGYATCSIGNSVHSREYALWEKMISRCYNPKDIMYNSYGAKGVSVCDRWYRFDIFLQDLPNIPNYQLWKNSDPGSYHIDKDILQKNIPTENKIYSPSTCMFVSAQENTFEKILRNSKIENYFGINVIHKRDGVYYNPCVDGRSLGVFTNIDAAATVRNYHIKNGGHSGYMNICHNEMDIDKAYSFRTKNSKQIFCPIEFFDP